MLISDADIPQALHGDRTLLVVPQPDGAPLLINHRLEDRGIDDPRFRALPVALRIEGLSVEAVERISDTPALVRPDSPLPTHADLLSALP